MRLLLRSPLQGDFFREAGRRLLELFHDGATVQPHHIANVLWAAAASRCAVTPVCSSAQQANVGAVN